jgi:hypothetical protein
VSVALRRSWRLRGCAFRPGGVLAGPSGAIWRSRLLAAPNKALRNDPPIDQALASNLLGEHWPPFHVASERAAAFDIVGIRRIGGGWP